jgi:outer membrane protein assembly factor BamE (lipoprotein component of BamABCDE complex)
METEMFRNHCRVALAVLGLSTVLAWVPGCLVADSSSTTYTGTRVAQSTFEQIKPGSTTMDWVHATLGDPNSKTRDGDNEVWKYTYTEHTQSNGTVFLIFAASNSNETVNTAFIEFKDGIVINKWRG